MTAIDRRDDTRMHCQRTRFDCDRDERLQRATLASCRAQTPAPTTHDRSSNDAMSARRWFRR